MLYDVITGVAVVRGPDGEARVAVARGRNLDLFRGDGTLDRTIAGPRLLGRLVADGHEGHEGIHAEPSLAAPGILDLHLA